MASDERHGIRERMSAANGVRLHVVEAGDGPPVLLLHGFPDFWYSWRRQMPALAAAGYRTVAVDLRGYNTSERPRGVASYALRHLVSDVQALAQSLGEPPVVVGHDWGGVIAWQLAMQHPDALRGLVILNAPHPATFARELWRLASSQKFRSWYAGCFQVPALPEALLMAGNRWLLRRALAAGPARHLDVMDDGALDAYLAAFPTRESLRAPIDYYRAFLREPPPPPTRVTVPTLVIWGKRDPYLVPELLDGLDAWVPGLRTVVLPDADHWVHHTHAAAVNDALLRFLASLARRADDHEGVNG